MANATVFPGDVQAPAGQGSFKTLYVASAFLTDAMVVNATGAGAGIKASKLQHQYLKHYSNTDAGTNAVSEQRFIHYVYGQTGSIVWFAAGAVVLLTGNDTCTIDLLVGGVSVLASAISLAAGDTVRVAKTGTINTPALVTANMIEVKVTATHNTGTLPKGVFAEVMIQEDAQ